MLQDEIYMREKIKEEEEIKLEEGEDVVSDIIEEDNVEKVPSESDDKESK